MGHEVLLAPLMVTESVAWQLPAPPETVSAVMLTSGSAVVLSGSGVGPLQHLPCFTVGSATSAAARAAGWRDVRDGGGTVQMLVDALPAAGIAEILHLAGEDRTRFVVPPAVRIEVVTVYRATLVPLNSVPACDWVLLYSARTAAHFAAECDRIGVSRRDIAIAAISPAALAAAGPGWARAVAAPSADEDALLAAIGIPCQ